MWSKDQLRRYTMELKDSDPQCSSWTSESEFPADLAYGQNPQGIRLQALRTTGQGDFEGPFQHYKSIISWNTTVVPCQSLQVLTVGSLSPLPVYSIQFISLLTSPGSLAFFSSFPLWDLHSCYPFSLELPPPSLWLAPSFPSGQL